MIELTHRGVRAMATVAGSGLLDGLQDHDPVVAGTYPLGLDRPDSDVDLLCCAPPTEAFAAQVAAAAPDARALRWHRRTFDDQPDAVVVNLFLDDLPVEVFAQACPTHQQHGYRHLVVERRLLIIGGAELQRAVRDQRHGPGSVEGAFARTLGLDGDPFAAVLALESHTDRQLRALVRSALEHPVPAPSTHATTPTHAPIDQYERANTTRLP